MSKAKSGHLCFAALLTMWPFSPAVASEPLPPEAAVLVRVTAPTISETPLIGTLVASNDRGVTLATFETGVKTIPRDAVTRMEWSSGRRSQSGAFARKGAIAVGLAFAVVGAIVYDDDSGERAKGAVLGAAGGAVWGALGGALVGAFTHSYQWKEGPAPGLEASVSPSVSGSSAGITIVLRW